MLKKPVFSNSCKAVVAGSAILVAKAKSSLTPCMKTGSLPTFWAIMTRKSSSTVLVSTIIFLEISVSV